eukprot:gnl/TRDRNA2_/TRDRNA2_45103_c0_seq1.p1 gnl/TRDRNA2_/TRDRNA2_45103_c0~~gnl/TRDRNA2_/TRDRNA2_45103_c0_seq1.p1  ORF type:complete len:513 (+),score=66.16 gnl/TRDRNA2_/TRDRNA2_45103_c0_seq1:65-1540(+)
MAQTAKAELEVVSKTKEHVDGHASHRLSGSAEGDYLVTLEVISALTGDTLARLDVKHTSELGALRSSVAKATDVPVYEQKLLWKEQAISDMSPGTTLKALGIANGSRLMLVRVPPPPPPDFLNDIGLLRINDCPKHPYTRCACHFNLKPSKSSALKNLGNIWPLASRRAGPAKGAGSAAGEQRAQLQPLSRLTQHFQSFMHMRPFSRVLQCAVPVSRLGRLFQSVFCPMRSPWQQAGYASLTFESKEALRDSWLMQARGEAVSAIGFEHLHEELRRFGAPEDLVAEAKSAALDEQRHADTCAKLASRFDPQARDHTAPVANRTLQPFESMESLVKHIALEGCWGETLGALTSATQHQLATDAEVKGLLETVAAEEFQHCVLSWKAVAWAVSVSSVSVADHFAKTIGQVTRATNAKAPEVESALHMEQFGILSLKAMDDIERTYGPQLVSDLLNQMNYELRTNKSLGHWRLLDFPGIIRRHCERVASAHHAV